MGQFYRNHLRRDMDVAAALRDAQRWVRELPIGEVVQCIEQWYPQSRGEDLGIDHDLLAGSWQPSNVFMYFDQMVESL